MAILKKANLVPLEKGKLSQANCLIWTERDKTLKDILNEQTCTLEKQNDPSVGVDVTVQD